MISQVCNFSLPCVEKNWQLPKKPRDLEVPRLSAPVGTDDLCLKV